MGIEAIRQSIADLTADELRALKALLDETVGSVEQLADPAPPAEAEAAPVKPARPRPEKRSHARFNVCLSGTARPLVTPAGARERTFGITIVDLSREGMRFRVDASAPLYPLAEVVFTGPTGRVRNVYVKLIRTRMIFGDDEGDVCEIAAHAIDPQELTAVQERQRRLRAAQRTVRKSVDTPVVLVGDDADLLKHLEKVVSSAGHPVIGVGDYNRLAEALSPSGPQVLVHLDGRQALLHRDMLAQLRKERPELATVAVFDSIERRGELLAAGIEECVHRVNATALLTMYIQRAVKARMLAAEADSPLGPVSVLLHVENNLQLAQLGMSSHRDNLNVSFSYDTEGMLSLLRCADIQAVVLDAKAASKDGWALVRRIREEFLNLPVLVAVDDLALGSEAVSRGATEYLQMPAKRQDLLTLVHTSRRAEEFEAARDGVGQDESGG
jgi:DNA-binding response OmpR family regulator